MLDAIKESNLEEKEWQDAAAAEERARKRLPELGMTIVDPSKDEMAKARQIAKAAWDIWLQRTGPDGKRGLELALEGAGPVAAARDREGVEGGGAALGAGHAGPGAAHLLRRPHAVLLQSSAAASWTSWDPSSCSSVIFGAAAQTYRVGGHVRVDLVTSTCRAPRARGCAVLNLALGLVFLAVVIWVTSQSALTAYRYGRVSAVLLYPLWLPMLLIPAGLLLMALCMVGTLRRQLRAALGPWDRRDEVPPSAGTE